MSDKLQDTLNQFKFGNLNESIQAAYDLTQFQNASINPLIEIIQDNNYIHIWWLAAQSLGRTEDKRAVEPLISLLKTPDSFKAMLARKYTVYALANLADVRAVDVLIGMLHEPAYQ